VITLAIDTCESRGSVAVRKDGKLVSLRKHETASDYSLWLLPSVDEVLAEAGITLGNLELLAVVTGPGSFTGLRVGLTSVKVWAEVYGTRVVGVSRLEAMARQAGADARFVAASYTAQRGQIFAGLYRRLGSMLEVVSGEMVIEAEAFLEFVGAHGDGEKVAWISLDPQLITDAKGWSARGTRGETVLCCKAELADAVGELAEERAEKGQFTDALLLDANYVRRSDAEILWKGPASRVR
jgi:tRNA threonylcarbamoyladenosine biosynthesis protein TsaB